jgi:AmiR/NasT family two-component response regulator
VDSIVINRALAPEGYLSPFVHQAEGMLSVRLDISVPEAVVVLRTMAHDAGTPLIDAARRVLARPQSVD